MYPVKLTHKVKISRDLEIHNSSLNLPTATPLMQEQPALCMGKTHRGENYSPRKDIIFESLKTISLTWINSGLQVIVSRYTLSEPEVTHLYTSAT